MEHSSSSQRLSGDSRFSCNICLDTVSDEPVVTVCGHVYCWSCLYQWLKPGLTLAEQAELGIRTTTITDASRRVCPTCKSSCSVRQVIPIYVRADEEEEEERNNGGEQKQEPASEGSEVLEVRSDGLRRRNASVVRQSREDRPFNNEAPPPNLASAPPQEEEENAIPRRESVFSPLSQSLVLSPDIPRRPTRPRHQDVRLSTPLSASLSHGMFPLPATQADDGATEYLSRLLLLLGSFVVLCLLVFP